MSINLVITAERKVKDNKTGKKSVLRRRIACWQTPTEVTYSIIAQADPLKAYCDWVRSVSEDEEEPVYARDDLFEKRDPVGFRTYNAGEEHIEELQAEINLLLATGWDIVYDTI